MGCDIASATLYLEMEEKLSQMHLDGIIKVKPVDPSMIVKVQGVRSRSPILVRFMQKM